MACPYVLIAFDLDGTLIDSRRDLALAINDVLRERGAEPLDEEAVGRMVGDGARVLVERAFAAAQVPVASDTLDRFLAAYDTRLLDHTRLYSGVDIVLESLASRARLTLLTNKPLGQTQAIVDALGLRAFFADVAGGDGPLPRKPAPDGLLRQMNDAGAEPHATLYVGDSHVDLETARRAGTSICLARYGFGYDERLRAMLRGDELMIDEPADLLDVVGRGFMNGSSYEK
jgi:phosphoglycolate phosphatase